MKVNLKSILLLVITVAVLLVGYNKYNHSTEPVEEFEETVESNGYFLDFSLDSFILIEETVKKGDFFADILLQHDIPYAKILTLAEHADSTFDIRKMNLGNSYYVLKSNDTVQDPKYFVYKKNEVEFVVFDLHDALTVSKKEKKVTLVEKQIAGSIQSSLYQTLINSGGTPELAVYMADIYAWSIDFYKIQKGDWFKVIYEEKKVDSLTIGVGKIKAMIFNHQKRDFYVFRNSADGDVTFYDEEGKSLQKFFLKAPVKYSRISSKFSKRRFHPVQKRFKSHLGTDYAAPHGTPIVSVADGKVIAATRKKFNGKYVKIKHNDTYTTQYLHMSGFAPGIKKGSYVKQGEVIGYVGSTGLATGPHVCFRFWKNGKQVDPYKEKFVQTEPKRVKNMKDYKILVDDLKGRLDKMTI